jgi:carbamoyltransferase
MKNLLLTLGHNSSAILIEDGKILWGYETERITGVKSDSRFPMPFVKAYIESQGWHMPKPDMVYVTHWAPDGQLGSMSAKHWDPAYFDGIPIRTLDVDRTHHDTHMAAAIAYAGPNFPRYKSFGLVVDGFGTFGEHFSIYDLSGKIPRLIERTHGYETSLGLWYQYATAFMGLKMHEDEYKLLGYEVHVEDADAINLSADAKAYAAEWLESMRKSIYGSKYDPLYDLSALANVKTKIFEHLTRVSSRYGVSDPSSYHGRCILAYYVQAVLEAVVITRVRALGARQLIVSGGCFYNVKLNKILIDMIEGQFCAYPLAGDQGNALGLYAMDYPGTQIGNNLCWGRRKLRDVGHVDGLIVTNEDVARAFILQALSGPGYINLVRGDMEFGPRALCNTSTLAMPTMAAVSKINAANDRNTVMPMAPVMTMAMYSRLFENTTKVWRSHAHMICAMEYQEHPLPGMMGVAHEYQQPYHHHTGRPQVIGADDTFMLRILNAVGHPLINTSFNFHGQPIALGMESIIKNHVMQHQRDPSFTTAVIQNV